MLRFFRCTARVKVWFFRSLNHRKRYKKNGIIILKVTVSYSHFHVHSKGNYCWNEMSMVLYTVVLFRPVSDNLTLEWQQKAGNSIHWMCKLSQIIWESLKYIPNLMTSCKGHEIVPVVALFLLLLSILKEKFECHTLLLSKHWINFQVCLFYSLFPGFTDMYIFISSFPSSCKCSSFLYFFFLLP